MRFANGEAAGKDRILVFVAAGQVDGEAPEACRMPPSQTTEGDGVAVRKNTVNIGKTVAVTNGDASKLRPSFALAFVEFLPKRTLSAFRYRTSHFGRPLLIERLFCLTAEN